jgi:hypothetical protein
MQIDPASRFVNGHRLANQHPNHGTKNDAFAAQEVECAKGLGLSMWKIREGLQWHATENSQYAGLFGISCL